MISPVASIEPQDLQETEKIKEIIVPGDLKSGTITPGTYKH